MFLVNSDGAYYQGGYAGTFALDAGTGSQKWYDEYNEPFGDNAPAVANGMLYSGVLEPESINQNVFALDTISGRWKWGLSLGGLVDCAPVVVNNVVYFVGPKPPTCATPWTQLLATNCGLSLPETMGVESSPAVADGVVYLGANDYNVYAVNATTGTKMWNYATGDTAKSWPAVANGVVYIGSADLNIYALDGASGALLWLYVTSGQVNSSLAVANGVVYVGCDDENVYALDAKTGTKLWNYTTGGSVDSSAAIANGVVCVGIGRWQGVRAQRQHRCQTVELRDRRRSPKSRVRYFLLAVQRAYLTERLGP